MEVVKYCEGEVASWLASRYNESLGVVCNTTGGCCHCVVDWGRGVFQYSHMGCGTPHPQPLIGHVFDFLEMVGIPFPVFMGFLLLFWIIVIMVARREK